MTTNFNPAIYQVVQILQDGTVRVVRYTNYVTLEAARVKMTEVAMELPRRKFGVGQYQILDSVQLMDSEDGGRDA